MDSAKRIPHGMAALFICYLDTLRTITFCRTGIRDVEDTLMGAGFFTNSGWMPARAGLMGGYGMLKNLYRMKETYHTIANEKLF